MTDIEIARICHEVNKVYCESHGDHSQVSWNDAPEWQKISALRGVQGILSGSITTPEQSHESWLTEKKATGWTYGPIKDVDKKEHPCFVPYIELPASQQLKDALFFAIVNATK